MVDLGGTRMISRGEVASLLRMDDCIAAVEAALLAHARGQTIPPASVGAAADGGAFHVKIAGLRTERPYFVTKVNGNFYGNTERFGLPRIQGLVMLCDARNGYPLAVMDSTEITAVRTAAATAVAARWLARRDSTVATICGCGLQGRFHLHALREVLPLAKVWAYDLDPELASRRAAEWSQAFGVEVVPAQGLAAACRQSDVCVTCTPSNQPLLGPDGVRPGTFIGAVGADSAEKQELEPELLRTAKVVVDQLEQCASIGELHHALDRGVLTRAQVHAELHQVVAGERPGRTSEAEITIFDSTGIALEDVAAAALVFEKAAAAGVGTVLELLPVPR